MKRRTLILFLAVSGILANSCIRLHANIKNKSISGLKLLKMNNSNSGDTDQIADYIVELFEDSKGNIWMGTMTKGVVCYDGNSLTYFSQENGLPSNIVVGMVEDKKGQIWLATHAGLSKYDGNSFTNYTTEEGLVHNRVSELMIDRSGMLWVGTWGGVSRFDGQQFTTFELPAPKLQLPEYNSTYEWVTGIVEDHEGNIWIGRDGLGVCRYSPSAKEAFTFFTKKDGLLSNNVQDLLEDKRGNIWIAARIGEKDHPDPDKRTGSGGVVYFDGETIRTFPEVKGLSASDSYVLYEDKEGHIWIGVNQVGIYKYNELSFTLFDQVDQDDLMPFGFGVQGILKDAKNQLWIGVSGGLFRLEGDTVTNVRRSDLTNCKN